MVIYMLENSNKAMITKRRSSNPPGSGDSSGQNQLGRWDWMHKKDKLPVLRRRNMYKNVTFKFCCWSSSPEVRIKSSNSLCPTFGLIGGLVIGKSEHGHAALYGQVFAELLVLKKKKKHKLHLGLLQSLQHERIRFSLDAKHGAPRQRKVSSPNSTWKQTFEWSRFQMTASSCDLPFNITAKQVAGCFSSTSESKAWHNHKGRRYLFMWSWKLSTVEQCECKIPLCKQILHKKWLLYMTNLLRAFNPQLTRDTKQIMTQ